MVWLVCRRRANAVELRASNNIRDFVEVGRVFALVMEASSKSSGSPPPALFMDYDIRDLKREIEQLKRMMDTIDTKGGRRLKNVDRDLVFLRKEFK